MTVKGITLDREQKYFVLCNTLKYTYVLRMHVCTQAPSK